ncbi:MAG: hypothetical protein O2999_13445, partial [Nitrospirae bacterium]|nr:hypothetical protein [Nitrospirota bacterium]
MAKTVLSRTSKVVVAVEKKNQRVPLKSVSSAVQAVISTTKHVANIVLAMKKESQQGKSQRRSVKGASVDVSSDEPKSVSDSLEANESQPEEGEKEIDLSPGDLSRTDDPVRLYLREMGSVSLLSRDGEIELAKRIEDGKHELSLAIAGMPMTLMYLDALRLAIKKGE